MKSRRIQPDDWFNIEFLFLLEHLLGAKLYKTLFSGFENKLFDKIASTLEHTPSTEVERLYEEYDSTQELPKKPCGQTVQVFRGHAKQWPCVQKWNFDFFEKQYNDLEIPVLNSEGLFEKGTQRFGTTTMGDYIRKLNSGSRVYLKFSPAIQHNSSLKNDLDINWLENFSLPGAFGRKFFLFIGPTNSYTPIHNALSNTIFIQIKGQKKWTFWEPSERPFIGVRPERRGYFFSHYDHRAPDLKKFPLAKYSRKFEITLNEGDALWFPSFFWHHVENHGNSIGVAYKTAHIPTAIENSSLLTALSFLATKPSIIENMIRSGFKNNERTFLD